MAIAARLAKAGARIVIADLRVDAARRSGKPAEKNGHQAIGLGGDVSKAADANELARATVEEFGRIDILVNNAGFMGRAAPLWELEDEDWDSVLSVDLTSVFLVSRAVIPHMRAQRSGSIVSVASIAGKEGTPRLIPYSVARPASSPSPKRWARK